MFSSVHTEFLDLCYYTQCLTFRGQTLVAWYKYMIRMRIFDKTVCMH